MLKMKTVVNPTTHNNEIVSVCAVCNKEVQIVGASEESSRTMTHLSIVRPLGNAAGPGPSHSTDELFIDPLIGAHVGASISAHVHRKLGYTLSVSLC